MPDESADKPIVTTEAPTAPAAAPRTEPKDQPQPPPRHAVILHNDPYSTVEFVIATLVKVLKIDPNQATRFTLAAHRTGRCAVWTGLKEHAEMKASLITGAGPDPVAVMSLGNQAKPLKTTIEPVPGS